MTTEQLQKALGGKWVHSRKTVDGASLYVRIEPEVSGHGFERRETGRQRMSYQVDEALDRYPKYYGKRQNRRIGKDATIDTLVTKIQDHLQKEIEAIRLFRKRETESRREQDYTEAAVAYCRKVGLTLEQLQ